MSELILGMGPGRSGRKRRELAAVALAGLVIGLPATAQQAAPPPSTDVTMNLIRLLVQQHVITQEAADGLIRQAQDQARAAAAVPAPVAGAVIGSTTPPGTPPPVHVTYVPEIVKQQLREEIKQEVLQTAKTENWAQPNALPDWVSRIRVIGDFRLRFEQDLYGSGNGNQFVDFNSINNGSPYDVSSTNTSEPPLLDTTEDRTRVRLRGRIGFDADVADGWTAEIRLSTGNLNNPVSPNETLGGSGSTSSSGDRGDFNKYTATFDRANLVWHPADWLTVSGGRFASPWFATDLVWYGDLNFDGIAVQLKANQSDAAVPYLAALGIAPFFTFGAFPVENTALSFPTQNLDKVGSRDKWLYAAQLGFVMKPDPDVALTFGAAYYDFSHLEGEISSPCLILTSADSCNTDLSRPGFIQGGNTLFAIRNLAPTAAYSTAAALPEYFGLASPFRVLALTERVDLLAYQPYHIIIDGEYAANLAFDRARILAQSPVNNISPSGTSLASGNSAFMAKLTVGVPVIAERWDWNAYGGYKYLEADSVVDAFTDADFHLGGTNAKGYLLGGNLGVAHNVWLNARWFSATQISGPPLAIDVLQLDLNAKF